MQIDRRLVWIIALIATFVLIVVLVTMGQRCAVPDISKTPRCGNHFTNWLYDFQPLITGMAAVIAAFLTISEMRRTAGEQALHHAENKKLATIEKRKQITRFIRRIRIEIDRAAECYGRYSEALSLEPIDPFLLFIEYIQMKGQLSNYRAILEEAKANKILDFFDPEFDAKLGELKTISEIVFEMREGNNTRIDDPNAPWVTLNDIKTMSFLFMTAEQIEGMLNSSEQLALTDL